MSTYGFWVDTYIQTTAVPFLVELTIWQETRWGGGVLENWWGKKEVEFSVSPTSPKQNQEDGGVPALGSGIPNVSRLHAAGPYTQALLWEGAARKEAPMESASRRGI